MKGRVCGSLSKKVSAAAFLFKLRGTSQPSIVQGSDDAFYVVKFNGFPGPQGLINEAIGADLVRWIGLPGPPWSKIEISSEFLIDNPGTWYRDENRTIRPQPGLHFGSRLIEGPNEHRTYQLIPHTWIEQIENREDFLGALVLDLWTNNCDRRQAVFLADQSNRLHAAFIDNDFMFGGRSGGDITCPRRVMAYDLAFYRGLWTTLSIDKWLRRIESINDNTIWRMIEEVPDEWGDAKMRLKIFNQLKSRRAILPRLLGEAKDVLRSSYSIQYHKAHNATEPAQSRLAEFANTV